MAYSELITHERYLGKSKTDVVVDELRIGDVIICNYKGEKDKEGTTRTVFILNPEYENKAHLIDLDKINHFMLLQLVTKMKNDISPYDFYHKIIKHSFREYQDAYRTYIIQKMHSIQRVDYNGLFSLAPMIKNNVYQTDTVVAISYDKKGVNLPSNHPLTTKIQELAEQYGVYTDTKPTKKLSEFIKRYAGNAKFVKSYKTDLFQPSIFQLRETIKTGGVFFTDKDSIKVLYVSIDI